MKHPFAFDDANYLNKIQTQLVNGGSFSLLTSAELVNGPRDGKAQARETVVIKPTKPITPPVYFTQAIGEDGGSLPEPSLL